MDSWRLEIETRTSSLLAIVAGLLKKCGILPPMFLFSGKNNVIRVILPSMFLFSGKMNCQFVNSVF
jgi:hypothetical protein